MCIHCDPGVDCAHDRETDTWVVPSGLTDLIRVHDIDVTLGAGRMCGYGHPLRGSASAHGDWWCHPSCDCHPDCYRVATATVSGPLAPADDPQAPGDPSARESASEAVLRRDGGR